MAEPLSIPLRRLLSLRRFTTFASIELGELAMVADNVVETSFAAGTVVATCGVRMPALHLVIDGRIEAGGEVWGPRQVFGLLEVLGQREAAASAIATVDTRTYQIAAGDAREILEDNVGLLLGMLRELAGRLVSIDAAPPPKPGASLVPSSGKLTLVERIIVLRQHVPFVGGRLNALAAVAHAASVRHWPAGVPVVCSGSIADGSLMILDGKIRVSRSGAAPRELGAGHAIGALESLARLRHVVDAETLTPVTALWSPGSSLVDIIEDHTDLGLTMIRTFAGALLDSAARPSN